MSGADQVARQERRGAIEKAIYLWMIHIPVQVTIGAFAVMMFFGALHAVDPQIKAIGWWTSVALMFGTKVLMLYLIEGPINQMKGRGYVKYPVGRRTYR